MRLGEELLQEIDKNGDGSIDFEEFMDMMERPVCKLIKVKDMNLGVQRVRDPPISYV